MLKLKHYYGCAVRLEARLGDGTVIHPNCLELDEKDGLVYINPNLFHAAIDHAETVGPLERRLTELEDRIDELESRG